MREPDARWVVNVSSWPPPAQLDPDEMYAVLDQMGGPWEPAEQLGIEVADA